MIIQINAKIHKSIIKPLSGGVDFLGFRCFYHHRRLKARNIRKFYQSCQTLSVEYLNRRVDYDKIYDFMEGWIAYAKQADTYRLRERVLRCFEKEYPHEISAKEISRLIKAG